MEVALAMGIVRRDLSIDAADDERRVEEWAEQRGFDLLGVRLEPSDSEFGLLLATLAPAGITTLIVPTVTHLAGWLDAARHDLCVWTLRPALGWPRLKVPSRPATFVPVRSS